MTSKKFFFQINNDLRELYDNNIDYLNLKLSNIQFLLK